MPEFYACLNSVFNVPRPGTRIIVIRESDSAKEIEKYYVNMRSVEGWREFVEKAKITLWVYEDVVVNLGRRLVRNPRQ